MSIEEFKQPLSPTEAKRIWETDKIAAKAMDIAQAAKGRSNHLQSRLSERLAAAATKADVVVEKGGENGVAAKIIMEKVNKEISHNTKNVVADDTDEGKAASQESPVAPQKEKEESVINATEDKKETEAMTRRQLLEQEAEAARHAAGEAAAERQAAAIAAARAKGEAETARKAAEDAEEARLASIRASNELRRKEMEAVANIEEQRKSKEAEEEERKKKEEIRSAEEAQAALALQHAVEESEQKKREIKEAKKELGIVSDSKSIDSQQRQDEETPKESLTPVTSEVAAVVEPNEKLESEVESSLIRSDELKTTPVEVVPLSSENADLTSNEETISSSEPQIVPPTDDDDKAVTGSLSEEKDTNRNSKLNDSDDNDKVVADSETPSSTPEHNDPAPLAQALADTISESKEQQESISPTPLTTISSADIESAAQKQASSCYCIIS